MTNETQIEAGPELDEIVAIEVMGWDPNVARGVTGHAQYSTSYEGLGLVLERMKALEWDVEINSYEDGMWHVGYGAFANNEGESATLPHAVALAALAAVRAS